MWRLSKLSVLRRHYSKHVLRVPIKVVVDISSENKKFSCIPFVFILALLASTVTNSKSESDLRKTENESNGKVFRLDEVFLHTTKENGVWVTFDGGVYDITKFIANHPGGQDKIMLAAGLDLAPFWNIYRQHYNSPLPMNLLKSMRIGSLHPDDIAVLKANRTTEDDNDPYCRDPVLSPVMKYYGRKPINAEPPSFLLADSWITPTDLFFVRNHHPVPIIDEEQFRLALNWDANLTQDDTDHNTVIGSGLVLSLDDLKTKFKPFTVVSTIQCGGHRRTDMNKVEVTSGIPWSSGIATGKWKGVKLRDLLLAAGVKYDDVYDDEGNEAKSRYNGDIIEDAGSYSLYNSGIRIVSNEKRIRHVHFIGYDDMQASIPIKKALSRDGDVLIAYEMNDAPLLPQHGAPLRAVVPGHAGVRNVKWLKAIKLSDEEATGPWQRGMAYKGFCPSLRSLEGIDVAAIPSLQEQPVQSAITLPKTTIIGDSTAAVVNAGEPLTVQGYAYSGGGRGIVRVDVSIDGGVNWKAADLDVNAGAQQPLDRAWAWTLWQCDFDIPEIDFEDNASQNDGNSTASNPNKDITKTTMLKKNQLEIICKATDASYNVQPDSLQGIWNLRGINTNAWHRVNAVVVKAAAEEQENDT